MTVPRVTFEERLEASKAQRTDEYIKRILAHRIPTVTGIEIADTSDDKNGTDYWAIREWLPDLSIDVKFRWTDPIEKYGSDDIAIETWSVCKRNPDNWDKIASYDKVGWCRDETKRTDYAMWFWTSTKRFFLVPFPPLCHVVSTCWEEWRTTRRIWIQDTEHKTTGRYLWSSEHIYIPRSMLIERLEHWMSGRLR